MERLPTRGRLLIDFLTSVGVIGALIAYYYDLLTQDQLVLAIVVLGLGSAIAWLLRKWKG